MHFVHDTKQFSKFQRASEIPKFMNIFVIVATLPTVFVKFSEKLPYQSSGVPLQLLPPDEDINGDTINCEPPNCSLHLHMDSTNYARLGVYSTESAPGIIVAHGRGTSILIPLK